MPDYTEREGGVEAIYSTVGGYIKQRRTHYGITQAELAEKVGLTRVSITNIEAGRQRVLLHTLIDILAVIDPTDPVDAVNLFTAGLLKDPKRRREVLESVGVSFAPEQNHDHP